MKERYGNPCMSAYEYWGILSGLGHWSLMQVKRRGKQGNWRPGTKQTLSESDTPYMIIYFLGKCFFLSLSSLLYIIYGYPLIKWAGLLWPFFEYINLLKMKIYLL